MEQMSSCTSAVTFESGASAFASSSGSAAVDTKLRGGSQSVGDCLADQALKARTSDTVWNGTALQLKEINDRVAAARRGGLPGSDTDSRTASAHSRSPSLERIRRQTCATSKISDEFRPLVVPVEDGRDVDNSFSNPSAANKCQKLIDKMISIFVVQV